MLGHLSRRKLSSYVARQLIMDNRQIIDELAALLIDENREREADLLVKDIESQLAEQGVMVVTVESAHEINGSLRDNIKDMFPGTKVFIREIIDPELIAGCRITTPSQVVDQTAANKLNKLKTMKV